MTDNFSIRFAKRDDSQLIFDFIVGIAAYEKMLDDIVGNVSMLESSIFDKGHSEVIIAQEDGVAVGFALFFHNYSTFNTNQGLYLEDLFVLPEMRGRGYGKALLLFLAKLAKERNCSRMEWACLDWNKPSIEFYKSLGATPMSEWTTYRFDSDTLNKLSAL